jgi:hypothetical protein
VGPQVEVHQVGDLVGLALGVAQFPQPGPGDARPDHLVVVEGHPFGAEGAGLRLAHVVEEGGETKDAVGRAAAHHRNGVGEDVLVLVDGILLQA